MTYKYFSRDGKLLPAEEAVVPLSNVEYSYGFGVYETIRFSKGTAFFLEEHCHRLLESATVISISHPFTASFCYRNALELIKENEAEACNVKITLIGGRTKETASLYMQCLNPLFPDRKLYKSGAHVITQKYERDFPHAKTLNMLSSYIAYRRAKEAGAFDALLVNRHGCIVEGTRSNFMGIKGMTLLSPPESQILKGVTREHVLKMADQNSFEIKETDISLADVGDMDGAFLTSTSSKIMPIATIDEFKFKNIPAPLHNLISSFDKYLNTYT